MIKDINFFRKIIFTTYRHQTKQLATTLLQDFVIELSVKMNLHMQLKLHYKLKMEWLKLAIRCVLVKLGLEDIAIIRVIFLCIALISKELQR